ncbi:MAG: hypothetical protein KF869_15200 [Phycisphaeraceae bacterium]|nr:hypothetical protein [Phycisphaeraceae bacterium]
MPHTIADKHEPAATDQNESFGTQPFEQAAATVLGRLQHALAEIIQVAPEPIRKAADVERVFGIDHRLGWQVYKIANARHPLAAGTQIPARVSFDRFVRTAAKKGVSASILEEVAAAFDDFETLVLQHAGSRAEFEALVASALPEEQERIDLESREALHNAARIIRGASMRTALFTHIAYPNTENPERLDVCNLMGNFGLQRTRRGSVIASSAAFHDEPGSLIRTIHNRPITSTADVMLGQFCTSPTPRVLARPGVQNTRYVLDGEDVGMKAAIDYVFADYLPGGRSRYAQPDRPLIGAAFAPDAPVQRQVIDVLVCDGVVPPQEPDARIYDIVPHGQLARVPDPDRELDLVATRPLVRALGRGLNNLRCLHVPQYADMLSFICAQRGWDPNRLQGYRVEIEFPVYSWQTVLTLALPAPPISP